MSRRVVLIGAGGIASRHLDALKQIDDVVVVGICDPDLERAGNRAKDVGAAVSTDMGDLVSRTAPDLVSILTPRSVRRAPIALCIEWGLPFLVEKPPCDTVACGEVVTADVQCSGLIHAVGFMHRWHESLNAALAAMAHDQLCMVVIRYVAPFASTPVYDSYPDPYLSERSGGLVGDQGIHYLDLARYISGAEMDKLTCAGSNRLLHRCERVTTVDTACWTLQMTNGVVVEHAHTWCGPDWDCRIELISDRSRINIDMFGNTAIGCVHGEIWEHTGVIDEFVLQYRGLFAAVDEQNQSLIRSSYSDALQSFMLADVINKGIYGT